MLYNLKNKISKLYTTISTIIAVALLFVIQFVAFESNLYFWKDASFWSSLVVMVAILLVANEVYWKNGSTRAEQNEKYINSAVEYSVRINRIKNNKPCLTADFYKYIDELNVNLYIDTRNKFLEENGILKEDYYYGHIIVVQNTDNSTSQRYSTPHCEMTYEQLRNLKRINNNVEENYYSKKQAKAIMKAVRGEFIYETLNATEILSGIKCDKYKYATSYDAVKNKKIFAKTNIMTIVIISITGALLGADLAQNGWSVTALFTFLYRVLMFAWRAVNSDEAGYRDIVETKRGVNVNRSNIATMYATARGLKDLFDNIDIEIQIAKQNFVNQENNNVNNSN